MLGIARKAHAAFWKALGQAPAGGLMVRLRAPAGKRMSKATAGGAPLPAGCLNATAEAVVLSQAQLQSAQMLQSLEHLVVTFA